MLQPNPDHGFAWVVAIACFSISFILAGLARASGFLYMAIIDLYHVGRESATTPFSVRFCVRNMCGPLVGILAHRYGMRSVVAVGGVFCGVGGILCLFATNVFWITMFWGVIHGIGYGMSNLIHVLILNEHFDKYKAMAIGLALSGDCFGSFVLPSLIEFLLSCYGIKGTFLILGAISFNIIPAAMLLRRPSWLPSQNVAISSAKKEMDSFELLKVEPRTSSLICAMDGMTGKRSLSDFLNYEGCERGFSKDNLAFEHDFYETKADHSNNYNIELLNELNANKLNIYSKANCGRSASFAVQNIGVLIDQSRSDLTGCRCSSYSENTTKEKEKQRKVMTLKPNFGDFPCKDLPNVKIVTTIDDKVQQKRDTHFYDFPLNNCIDIIAIEDCRNNNNIEVQLCIHSAENKTVSENAKEDSFTVKNEDNVIGNGQPADIPHSILKQFFVINIHPMFLLICVTLSAYVFLFIALVTIINDYAEDISIAPELANLFIIGFSITDLFGRIGLGVVIDKKWIGLRLFAGLSTGLMGLFIFIIPFCPNFFYVLTCMSLCGFVQGGSAIMYPVLIEHYMEKNQESIALGCVNFYGGLLMLPLAPVIGFFRDTIGSYDGVFWTVGGLCICAGLLWLMEPRILKLQRKNKLDEDDAMINVVHTNY